MALAYGTSVSGSSSSATITQSITPAATDNTMLVATLTEHGTGTPPHGTLKYNGNSMTFVASTNDGANTDTPISTFYYYIGLPDGSAHDIVSTAGDGTITRCNLTAVTLTGASSTVGGNASNHGSSTSLTITVTTTGTNSIIVDGINENGTNALSNSGNSTNRVSVTPGDGTSAYAGTTTAASAGSNSVTYTKTGTASWGGNAIEIIAAPTVVPFSTSDSSATTDTASLMEMSFINKADTSTVSDVVSLLLRNLISVFDSTAVSDTVRIKYDWVNLSRDASSWATASESSSTWTNLSQDTSTFANQTKS